LQIRSPWRLDPSKLRAQTLEAINQTGLSAEVSDVPQILDRLEREIGQVNGRLLTLAGRKSVRQIGATRVYQREPISQGYNVLRPQLGGPLIPGIGGLNRPGIFGGSNF